MAQGILQQVGGDQKDQDEHEEGEGKPPCHEPVVLNSDEEDSSDNGCAGGKDTQQYPPGLEMEKPLLPLDIPGVYPHP